MRQILDELRKVVRPTGPELVRYTTVVVVFVVVMMALVVRARLRASPADLLGLHGLTDLARAAARVDRCTAAHTGWSTNKEVGQSVSEQFAHAGRPERREHRERRRRPRGRGRRPRSASDVESGAADTTRDSDVDADDPEAEAPCRRGRDESEQSDEAAQSDDAEPVAQGSGDPVADFKADLRTRFGDWYVIHSYAGYENRVKANLETRIQTLNMEDFIFEIEVPMEEVTEIKNGQKKLVRRVRMPGYVLVRMDLTDESWGAVRHTPGVTGFVGNAHQPVPLSIDEVFTMLAPTFEAAAGADGAAASGTGGSQGRPRRRLRGRRVRHRHGRARSRPSPPRSPRSTPTPRSSRCWSRSSAGRPRSSCPSPRSPRSEPRSSPVRRHRAGTATGSSPTA